MSRGRRNERCWTLNSGGFSSVSRLKKIPLRRAGITTFSVQMATSCITNWLWKHGLQIALGIATYIISSGMSVFCASARTMNLEIMSVATSSTRGGTTTYITCSAMPTPRQPMLNYRRPIFTQDSTCLETFPVSWAPSLSPTSSIQCRSACLTTSSSVSSTSWRRTNGSTRTMLSGYPCLLTITSHQKTSHMKKFLNGMGRWWRKWAGTCLEL